jgi:cupin fold WbuC family metalloprotein
MPDFKLALDPPSTNTSYFEKSKIEEAIELSRRSPRKRIIYPIHKSDDDRLHRMFNIIQPGSYIRPHRHKKAGKSEAVVVLQGGIRFITFEESGEIKSSKNLYAGSDYFGVDSEPEVIHTFFALEEDTVIFEVKNGPYIKELDKDFATWAPEELTPEAD